MYRVFKVLTAAAGLLSAAGAGAQTREWTLDECIEYARRNNITVRNSEVSQQIAGVELDQTKASRYPTLSFSTNHNGVFQNKSTQYNEFNEKSAKVSYSGSYNLNSGMTLFSGGRIRNNIKQQNISLQALGYDTETARNDIEIAVVQAYLQVLYAAEDLEVNRQTVELSTRTVERARYMFEAGSIARSDLAQLQSQLASDKYQVTVAENSLSQYKLQLKQLLELGEGDSFEVAFPQLDDQSVLSPIPTVEQVWSSAQSQMPQMQSGELNVSAAEAAESVAKASFYPTVSLSVGMSTGTYSDMGAFFDQLNNKLNESVGVSVSIPIFNGKQARSSLSRAKLQTVSARLQLLNTRKELYSTIESLHNDAVAAQNRYAAACEQLTAAEESYRLASEQFDAGLKNTVELVTEQNNYLSARSQQLQAKFQAVLSLQLLNFYRGEPIRL